jgi:hypothetical protein
MMLRGEGVEGSGEGEVKGKGWEAREGEKVRR